MLEQLKYINHQNEVFEFGKDGIFVNTNDLHDYEWTVTKRNNKISAFDRAGTSRTLPIIIICKTDADGIAARNRLMNVVEKDVLAMKHGKIIIGDYYFRCFVTKSKKSNYLLTKRYTKVNLTLTTDFPFWVKETTNSFHKSGTAESGGTNFDYNFDYPFDYSSETASGNLINTGIADTNFKMIIYGACVDPAVYINGHLYQVNCTVNSGEYLTIDSVTKKITLTATNGTITNVFKLRNRDSYIFQKIPPGSNAVSWEGDYGIDITLLDERSEPSWT